MDHLGYYLFFNPNTLDLKRPNEGNEYLMAFSLLIALECHLAQRMFGAEVES